MEFKIFMATVCTMALFSSQAIQAESVVLSDKSDISSVAGNSVPAAAADTVFSETTVSQVRHYNNILSKTVTTVERGDTVYAPVVRWNLAFNIGALSGGRKQNGVAKEVPGLPPLEFEAKYPTIYYGLVDQTSDAFSLGLDSQW